MTPEGKVKAAVKRCLKKFGVYYFMPVQTGLGAKTLDFLCCVRGIFFAIETKAPGNKPTPLQLLTIEEIEQAGGKTLVIDSTDTSELEVWLKHVTLQSKPQAQAGRSTVAPRRGELVPFRKAA
jgi:hypothetical protein